MTFMYACTKRFSGYKPCQIWFYSNTKADRLADWLIDWDEEATRRDLFDAKQANDWYRLRSIEHSETYRYTNRYI